MKIRTGIIVGASIGFLAVLITIYMARDWWVAKAQIEEWERVKYKPDESAPAALPIEIVGRQFEWHIRYPNSGRFEADPQLVENFDRETSANRGQADDLHLVNELHLWKGGKALLHLKSTDVPHSFFVPALRLKQDVIPGKTTKVWLTADQSNVTWNPDSGDWKYGEDWEFACAEHSFQGQTKMSGLLLVHETKDDFLKWLKQAEEGGLQLPKGK
jgi:cytochrome c oxidase subunit II